MSKMLSTARKEGRICKNCGWVISKEIFNQFPDKQLCGSCIDALKGVNVRFGHYQFRDEPKDKTGEM
jgi:hypothetical protein